MKISVVICTYNREQFLPECLEHLKNQTAAPESFEIVLINNNSTDNTEAICLEFQEKNPALNVLYVVEKNPGLSHARNCGIKSARGEIISFIDDDGFAIPEYVAILLEILEDPANDSYISFGGKVIPRYGTGSDPKWISKYVDGLVSKVDLGDERKPFDKKYPAGCNMVFRKEFFEQYGGFNVDLHTRSDEKFVFNKLKKAGLTTLYIPELKVEHFIDAYRVEKSFIVKLSKIIGQSEAIRIKDFGNGAKFKKALEYLFKFGAALLIALGFVLQGQFAKAHYVILVRWFVMRGLFIKDKI